MFADVSPRYKWPPRLGSMCAHVETNHNYPQKVLARGSGRYAVLTLRPPAGVLGTHGGASLPAEVLRAKTTRLSCDLWYLQPNDPQRQLFQAPHVQALLLLTHLLAGRVTTASKPRPSCWHAGRHLGASVHTRGGVVHEESLGLLRDSSPNRAYHHFPLRGAP
jgi:hypothetical protein